MNPEKVAHFIVLIDTALECVDNRRKKVETGEIDKYDFIIEGLNNFEETLKVLKYGVENDEYKEDLSRPKGHRPGFGMIYGIGEIGDALGEPLYNYELSDALYAVESYFDDELD